MSIVPIHFGIDLEPDTPLPEIGNAPFESIGFAFRDMFARRQEIADCTRAAVQYGWYVRMDGHIEKLYGSRHAIADRYQSELEAAAAAGDEIGMHVHVMEKPEGGVWRANYADRARTEDEIEKSVEAYEAFFGRKPRSARMGDMWAQGYCAEKFEALGIRYDLSLESGLRAQGFGRLYPGTNSKGVRQSLLAMPVMPYQPSRSEFREPGGDDARDIWMIPLSSAKRSDVYSPGYWIMSAATAISSGFKRNTARMVLRPQTQYQPGEVQAALRSLFGEIDNPCACLVIRNFGVPDRVHHFIDVLCEMAKERQMQFVRPDDYVRLTMAQSQHAIAPSELQKKSVAQ
ncbi:hypothetical protein ABFZ85_09705 [Hyphococcus formosus]|uniref:hypothetical protein n=1 Tax=Hyphococcus formosus TaxID=3143534 RepID=UPI00398B66FE